MKIFSEVRDLKRQVSHNYINQLQDLDDNMKIIWEYDGDSISVWDREKFGKAGAVLADCLIKVIK